MHAGRARVHASYGDWEGYCVKTLCQYLRGRVLGFEGFCDGIVYRAWSVEVSGSAGFVQTSFL